MDFGSSSTTLVGFHDDDEDDHEEEGCLKQHHLSSTKCFKTCDWVSGDTSTVGLRI